MGEFHDPRLSNKYYEIFQDFGAVMTDGHSRDAV